MLRVEALRFSRSHFKMGPISFELKPGESLFVVGRNGAGKTSLMKLILGLLRPEEGRVLDSADFIGQVGVSPFLFDTWNVQSNQSYFEKLSGKSLEPEFTDRISNTRSLLISHLSAGMRRDVELSIQLGLQAPVYLLDEAFSHLDPDRTRFFKSKLEEAKKRGTSFVYSVHDESQIFDPSAKALRL
ncbi:MAG: ATP-binding cassette domain-containing protein [Bradymonadales bacterium]|nr:MAG: ATP-binding cassette domain-containing protein [Bradymonadales bacterium]